MFEAENFFGSTPASISSIRLLRYLLSLSLPVSKIARPLRSSRWTVEP